MISLVDLLVERRLLLGVGMPRASVSASKSFGLSKPHSLTLGAEEHAEEVVGVVVVTGPAEQVDAVVSACPGSSRGSPGPTGRPSA